MARINQSGTFRLVIASCSVWDTGAMQLAGPGVFRSAEKP